MSGAEASGMKGASEAKLSLSPCGNCRMETSQCCGNRRKESFCSDIGQEARRKQHELNSFPAKEVDGYALITRPGRLKEKRFWAATQYIKKGETIFTDYPLLTGPGEKEYVPGRQICLGCHKILENFDVETDERKCGACGWPLCGEACPGIHRHLNECETLCRMKRSTPPETDFKELVTRTAVDVRIGYGIIRVVRIMGLVRDNITKLQSFLKLNVPGRRQHNPKEAVSYFKSGGQIDHLSNDTILPLISVALNCRRSPYYPQKDKAELLIYEKETRMDVSCMGNCYVSRIPTSNELEDPHGIAVVAAQPILKGERLTITRGNPKWDGTKRRRETQMKNGDIGFICKCARCSDPTELGTNVSAIKCTECKAGLLLPFEPLDDNSLWKCNAPGCSGLVSASDVDEVVNQIQKEANALTPTPIPGNPFAIDSALIDPVTKFVEKYEKILNPHHYILLNVQELTLNTWTLMNHVIIRPDEPFSSGLSQKIDEYRRIAEMFLDLASKIFPPISNPSLMAHFRVGMSNFYSAQQAVRNEKETDVVLDWFKEGILHRRHVTEIEIKMSLTLPFQNPGDPTLMTYLGEAYDNVLQLCRSTPNYSGIPDKILEFDQNPSTSAVLTATIEEN